jgi:hypothetical protein
MADLPYPSNLVCCSKSLIPPDPKLILIDRYNHAETVHFCFLPSGEAGENGVWLL